MSAVYPNPVYLVDGARTPFLKARNKRGPFSASDLAVACSRELLLRQPFLPSQLDEVILGSTVMNAAEPNIARVVSLRLQCGDKVPAFTVHRNCGSGLQSIDTAARLISNGTHNLVLAGGMDDMSRSPLIFTPEAADWFAQWASAKTLKQRLGALGQLRLAMLQPIISVLQGLTDPIVSCSMGQTAENLAYKFNISRAAMDMFSLLSHQRTIAAQDAHLLTEIITLFDEQGHFYSVDDGARRDTTLAKLASLKPFFDKKFGSVTAGNSSQITDGAATVILASEQAVKDYKLPILARLVDAQWAGLDPAIMGLGPVHATTPLLLRQNLRLNDIDYWEINEAFAAQVLACYAAWEDKKYCEEALGIRTPLGKINQEHVNIDGGAIAMGHPIGASGARWVIRLAHILKREKARLGIATICIGGGQGGAMLLENVEGVAP